MLLQDVEQRGRVERELAGGAFEQDHAERIEISARVDHFGAHLFGRHVVRRSEQRAGTRLGTSALIGTELGDPEIEHLGAAERGNEHVVGLEIAVNDRGRVRRFERAQDLERDADQEMERKGPPRCEASRKRLAVEILHHDVGTPVR